MADNTRISIVIDNDDLDFLKSKREKYQLLIKQILKRWILEKKHDDKICCKCGAWRGLKNPLIFNPYDYEEYGRIGWYCIDCHIKRETALDERMEERENVQ